MKKLLLIAALAIASVSFAQANSKDEVVNALKSGDVASFNNYFDNTVDVKLPDKAEAKNVEKGQAGNIVKDFYKQNGIKGFDLTSERAMGGTMYMAGKLTGGAKEYNLTVMLKDKDSKLSVITVRIN
ncbi:MAG TPA: DUF4783 domain-containing protein [Chitinophagaceae bacterium]|nr:DUF4783 domain-containing protein [Chitinophagaceae bacterium]